MIRSAFILVALFSMADDSRCGKGAKGDDDDSTKSDPSHLPFFPNRVVGCGELTNEQRKTPSLWLRFVGPDGPVPELGACVTSRTFDGAWRDFEGFQQEVKSGEDGCIYVPVDTPDHMRRGRLEYLVTVEGGGYLGVRKGLRVREGVTEVGVRVWKGPQQSAPCGRPAGALATASSSSSASRDEAADTP